MAFVRRSAFGVLRLTNSGPSRSGRRPHGAANATSNVERRTAKAARGGSCSPSMFCLRWWRWVRRSADREMLAPVPGKPAVGRRDGKRTAGGPQTRLEARDRRIDRFVGGDRGRHGVRRVVSWRSRRCRSRVGKTAVEVLGRQSHRRVVADRGTGDGLRRRQRRGASRRPHARRQPRVDVQDGSRDQVVARCRRCDGAHRILRRTSLRARRRQRGAPLEVCDRRSGPPPAIQRDGVRGGL